MAAVYNIAVIAGDGIGKEVIPAGRRLLETVAEVDGGFSLRYESFPWGCDYYLEHGRMMPADALQILEPFDAIYFGAAGWPATVPDHISLWEFILAIRKGFDQAINLRPIRLLPGLPSLLQNKGEAEIDFVCVRENTEGEYSGIGGRHNVGTPQEMAIQTSIFTRRAVERVMEFAFELARTRPKQKVTSVTKSNACQYSMVLWDEICAEFAARYPDVEVEKWHVDAMAARFITNPETLDVVVGSNLFGDILSDLGGALMGSLGLPPSANLNLERKYPSMFESVHGSAPDIAGQGIANPIAAVWAGAMMLDFLGEEAAGDRLLQAIIRTIACEENLPRDLGGRATCREVTAAIEENLWRA